MLMKIRKACLADVEAQMELFDYARSFMRSTGNMHQWTNGYPSREVLEKDIAAGNSYVCVDDEQELVATFCFFQEKDPTYDYIEGRYWLNDEPYGVVHRLAGGGKVKGLGRFCLDWCYDRCPNIRVDTHADNVVMQSLLEKCGFVRCGIIYLSNGDPRVAFHKC